jgi:hypothetical protein
MEDEVFVTRTSEELSYPMSTNFQIKIESVSGETVRAHFTVCNPDHWRVPCTRNIALQTIVEIYLNMKMGFIFEDDAKQPIDEDQAAEIVRAHPRQAQLEYWLELAQGKSVPITEQEFERLNSNRDEWEEGLASIGSRDDGVYHKQYRPEYSRFLHEAQEEILEVHLDNERGNPRRNEDDPDPEAVLVFTVRDALHLAHLVEGYYYDTSMYDFTRYGADAD